ncbi:alanine racemase [Virgibacillus dakarensis]|nr:alanine racemase [Virgibacillus dakarensis]
MLHSPLFKFHHPTVAEIDLSAFKENVRQIKQLVNTCKLLAVIKTNAYGHGIIPIGKKAVDAGADGLGVTTVEEGAFLRDNGIDVPIHILSAITLEEVDAVIRYRLTASISSGEIARAISRTAAQLNRTAIVHLKIDTGLHRFGVDPKRAIAFCQSYYNLPSLKWEGIYTHFSSADDGDFATTEQQFALFLDTVSKLNMNGFNFPIRHVGGSTIAIERSDMHLDMVRSGIALFGYPPAQRQRGIISLKPVLKLKSKIVQIHELPGNTPVGYGGEYVTRSVEKIAVVPIGHGDGYQRALSSKGEMLVHGKRAKIVGIISLDQTLINVTEILDVNEGDEVVLIGKQGNDEISAREVSGWVDSIVDEVLASLMERIPRIYV